MKTHCCLYFKDVVHCINKEKMSSLCGMKGEIHELLLGVFFLMDTRILKLITFPS